MVAPALKWFVFEMITIDSIIYFCIPEEFCINSNTFSPLPAHLDQNGPKIDFFRNNTERPLRMKGYDLRTFWARHDGPEAKAGG